MTKQDSDSMTGRSLQLLLRIAGDSATDLEESEALARQLRRELLELDVAAVDPMDGSRAPKGTKAADATILGSMLVTLVASGGVLTAVINKVWEWLTKQERRSVTVEIGGDKLTIDSATSEQQQRLIDDFIRRHQE